MRSEVGQPTSVLEQLEVPEPALGRHSDRSNVLQLAARHPEPGVSPLAALHRVHVASVALASVVAVLVGASAVWLGSAAVLVTAAAWWTGEVVVVGLQRHLDEASSAKQIIRRHVGYAMSACVVGVIADASAAAVHAVYVLAVLAVVQTVSVELLRRPAAHRLLGMASAPSVLIVADRSTAHEAVEDRAGLTSSAVVGICLVEGADHVQSVAGVPVLGNIDDVLSLVKSLNVHEVSVRLEEPLDNDWFQEFAWSLEELGARLTLVTKLRNTVTERVRVSRVGNSIVLGVSQARPTGLARHLKAATEMVVAGVCLVLAAPVLLVCAVALKLDSAGPVLFRQVRVRDGGRTFTMLKLRTMTVDAESKRADLEGLNEVGGGLFKMKSDPRVTRVGQVLRKLSLDELPQLVNILRGQMSLVGPRPALPSEVATYDVRARRRLGVKPGLTGLWQVSGRSNLSWDESLSLDIDYVDNWTPSRDVRIAIETVRAVAAKDGAY